MAEKNNRRNKTTDALFDAILSLETREECYNFFEDLCTVKEISDMAQRLEAAKLLLGGSTYDQIVKAVELHRHQQHKDAAAGHQLDQMPPLSRSQSFPFSPLDPVRRSRGTPPPPFRRPMLGRDGADPPPNVPCRHDAPSPVGIYSKLYAPTGRDMRLWESSAPAEKETGKGLPSQSLALARFAGRYPSRPSIAAHRAVLSRMEGMRTRSSVVWICSAMAERASTVGTP